MEKARLIREIGETVMLWQDATQAYDEQVGKRFGLSAAERHCIALLAAKGPQTASAIAKHVWLTPAAVTALLDRLEQRSFLRRLPDPADRRKIMVEAAEMTWVVAKEAYQPIGEAGQRMLDEFSGRELETILKFLRGALDVQKNFTKDSAL